jgi:hypothetical protein
VVTTGFIFSSSPRPIQDYSHGMRVRVLDLGINKESLPIFGYVIAHLLEEFACGGRAIGVNDSSWMKMLGPTKASQRLLAKIVL